jgi:hypothetical protein
MEIEIRPIVNPMTKQEIHHSREIVVWGNTYNFSILVGIGRRQMINEPVTYQSLSVSMRELHTASIAVVMDFLGNMKIVKNRWGQDMGNLTNLEVRQEIMTCIENVGFSYYETMMIMGNFNQAVAECLDEPVITDARYPLGINYRDYMRRGVMIKDYKVKRHSLV